MKVDRSLDVQRAIAFLSSPELRRIEASAFPSRIDYESLAQQGRRLGHDVSPAAIKSAFQLIMRARRVAAQSSPAIAARED